MINFTHEHSETPSISIPSPTRNSRASGVCERGGAAARTTDPGSVIWLADLSSNDPELLFAYRRKNWRTASEARLGNQLLMPSRRKHNER
jgi:hypothetical protein